MSGYRRGGELRRSAARPPEQRHGNRLFYVVAEGEGTEYDYLGHLNRMYGADHRFLVRWPAQRRGLSASRVVDEAIRAHGDPEAGSVQVWALFDHDGRRDIDEVVARARRANIDVALSHPSFELWLLMHFQDFPLAAQSGSNRVIMEKLRAADPAFASYKEGDKRIDMRRFSALCDGDGIRRAVEGARRLSMALAGEAPSRQDPSTGVGRLLENLGIVRSPQARGSARAGMRGR